MKTHSVTPTDVHPSFRQRCGFPLLRTLVAALLLVGLSAGTAMAGGIELTGTWIRWLPGDLPLGGYFTLHNGTDEALRLTGASAPDFDKTMLHKSVEKDGTERMVHVDSIKLKPGGTLHFAPGGYHVMLMHRKHPIQRGDRLPITLKFAGREEVTARFPVKGPNGE